MTKQLSVEDVIQQMQDMFKDPNAPQGAPTRLLVNPSQMAIVRQMMDAGTLSNYPPERKEIFEDEVPKVQQPDHGA
jgi:hypothetical protein